jgi:serine/threonine-protein kinase RsbW
VDLDQTDRIRLSVPAATSAVRIARAGAAGLATRVGFTYQEVEQLQLAVAEAAALLAHDAEGQGTLVVTFDVEPTQLVVDLTLTDAGSTSTTDPAATITATRAPAGRDVPELATAMLDAAVDDWHVDPGAQRIVLRKRMQDIDLDE